VSEKKYPYELDQSFLAILKVVHRCVNCIGHDDQILIPCLLIIRRQWSKDRRSSLIHDSVGNTVSDSEMEKIDSSQDGADIFVCRSADTEQPTYLDTCSMMAADVWYARSVDNTTMRTSIELRRKLE